MPPPVSYSLQWCEGRLALVLPEGSTRRLITSIAGLEAASWLLILTLRSLREIAPAAALAVNLVLGVTGAILTVLYPTALLMVPIFALVSFLGRGLRSKKDGKLVPMTQSAVTATILLALNWKIFTKLLALTSVYGFYNGFR
jgi:hypothetical protein